MFFFFRRRRQRSRQDNVGGVSLGRIEDRELLTARADSQRSLALPTSNNLVNPDYISVNLPPQNYDVVPPTPDSDQGNNNYTRIMLSATNSANSSNSNSSANTSSRSYVTLPSAELARAQPRGGYGVLKLDSDIVKP